MEKTEAKVNDFQKLRIVLEGLGDIPKVDLDNRTLHCHNRDYIFNSDFELIEVKNV